MAGVCDYFGELVFDDRKMKERLTDEIYQSLHQTIREGRRLDPSVAKAVAGAMKDWAVEHGATHFTHWFQPMTGVTAEKHDGFVVPGEGGSCLMEFSGKELMRGEPDASSFPSGGLRATFEARGYTFWDASSPAFIKGNTLCIPTAFCSYTGEALDKKTPLLRSMEVLNKAALRILRLFSNTEAKQVIASVGAEQEYFLIDSEQFYKRRDLVYTGRTLFGAKPPKGQEMDDHYFGVIKPRVKAFMEDLDRELWRLGIYAKTEHNEVAPGQHELACVYTTANIATDQNQLVMEMMQRLAREHQLVCLLHEKPFAGVNGSGKHNNWSIATDSGQNLLSPGETPHENAQFLLLLTAIIEAVDEYQDFLRISIASAANDHRLGASEAPPAVISVFLGDELTGILEAIERDEEYKGMQERTIKLGVDVLPKLKRDTTDRNRTSPFAFTSNKFEFRMVGSSNSIAGANIALNSAVAKVLNRFADALQGAADFNEALHTLLRDSIRQHKRIIFNGNGYDDAWIREATEIRGLSNYQTTPDARAHSLDPKNLELFTSLGIFTESEMRSRMEIHMENYYKTVEIEARTMVDMSKREILPATAKYTEKVLEEAAAKARVGIPAPFEEETAKKLSNLTAVLFERTESLRKLLARSETFVDATEHAMWDRDAVIPLMDKLRLAADELELLVAKPYWPFPTYGDIFFGVH